MSKLIGKPRDRNILDELIENTREANAEFLKEIERERLEEERILKEINKEILEADTKAGENEEKRKKRQKDGFAEIQKRLNELTDPNYKPIIPKVDVFPPKAKPAPKEKLGKRIHKYLLEDPSTAKTFGKVMLYITLPALTAMLGTIRGCAEISERTDYGAECVTARRYVGIFGKQLEFEACNSGKRKIIRNNIYEMTDSNSDGIVDTLDNRGTLYTRPHSRIDEAQEGWKEDWEALEADEILKGWQEWKVRQR